jgi:hypothetical protein
MGMITHKGEMLLKKLLYLVISHQVVDVRGIPTSGNSVLSRLLYIHILEQKEYIPIYITWELRENRCDGKHWLSYLCEKGSIPEGSF